MHSSKIFRSNDADGLKRISFREFGPDGQVVEDGLLIQEENFSETIAPPQETDVATVSAVIQAPPADVGKQIEEAYLQGKEEGQQEIRLQFENSLEMLAQGIEEVSRLRATLLQNSTQDMLRLVLSIARQVIHGEVSLNRELILTTIEKALRAAVRSDHYHIKVHL
ncbi:MAG: FliH/SctL family protein [Syntrophotaleaceae bacterium]